MMTTILDRPDQIARFRLAALTRAFRFKVDHGMSLTRRMPRCGDVIAAYKLDCKRTTAAVADALAGLLAEVEAGTAGYEIRDGICHYFPGPGPRTESQEAAESFGEGSAALREVRR